MRLIDADEAVGMLLRMAKDCVSCGKLQEGEEYAIAASVLNRKKLADVLSGRNINEHIQQLEAQVPKWISVKEKMPEREVGLLLYADGHVYDGYLDYCGVCFEDEEGIIGDVTHWMLPPEPPEEEKDEEP